MAYVGGKAKCATHILDILNDPAYDGMTYFEPFVGYGHILRRVVNKNKYIVTDINPLVVSLLQGIQKHTPLKKVSRVRYYELKPQSSNHSFERAIACFAQSYNGRAWGGYVTDNRRSPSFNGKVMDYCKQRFNYYRKLQENPTFMSAEILPASSYDEYEPHKCLIYCDPPYEGTTQYDTAPFDHEAFWATMREWSRDNIVYISEYSAPADFVEVAGDVKHCTLSADAEVKTRVEKLFMHKSLM